MKYELTREQLEELAECIATCNLTPDEACEYIIETAGEMQETEDARIVWPEKSGDNMEFTHLTGEAVKAGVYES